MADTRSVIADGYYLVDLKDGVRVEAYDQTISPRHEDSSSLLRDEDPIRQVLQTMDDLRGPAREAAIMKLAKKIKLQIFGEECSMDRLLRDSMAVPAIHAVITDEVIRLGVGRREYRAVVVPSFNRIRDAIGWKDVKGVKVCPQWQVMKKKVIVAYGSGPNKALHVVKPDWKNGNEGCVWTEVDLYLAERLIAYRAELVHTSNLTHGHVETHHRRVCISLQHIERT